MKPDSPPKAQMVQLTGTEETAAQVSSVDEADIASFGSEKENDKGMSLFVVFVNWVLGID